MKAKPPIVIALRGLDSLAERVERIVDRHWPPRKQPAIVENSETSEIEAKTA